MLKEHVFWTEITLFKLFLQLNFTSLKLQENWTAQFFRIWNLKNRDSPWKNWTVGRYVTAILFWIQSLQLLHINNLRNSAIQSDEIIFILCMWQGGSLSEHNDSKLWRIDSKSWCHERQVHFLLKRVPSARTAPRTQAFINLRDDLHAWTDRNSLTGIDRQWVQK